MVGIKLFSYYFGALVARFPAMAENDELGAIYHDLISQDLDDEQFEIAIKKIIRDCEFFPSPKQIIEAAPSLNGLLRAEMIRLDIYCNLPKEWQFSGARTVAELPQDKQREYLAHLRTIKAAIAPSKP
jgi:hypothetical protein